MKSVKHYCFLKAEKVEKSLPHLAILWSLSFTLGYDSSKNYIVVKTAKSANFCSKNHKQVKRALQIMHNHQKQQSQPTFFQYKTAVVELVIILMIFLHRQTAISSCNNVKPEESTFQCLSFSWVNFLNFHWSGPFLPIRPSGEAPKNGRDLETKSTPLHSIAILLGVLFDYFRFVADEF